MLYALLKGNRERTNANRMRRPTEGITQGGLSYGRHAPPLIVSVGEF